MDPDDHRLIHADTFEEVGVWDTETEKIIFDEDYEHPQKKKEEKRKEKKKEKTK